MARRASPRCAPSWRGAGSPASSFRAPTSTRTNMSPPGAERLLWLTGFSGSAGLAVVLADQAALFVDGRYTLQAPAQVDGAVIRGQARRQRAAAALDRGEPRRGRQARLRSLAAHAGSGRTAGESLRAAGGELVAVESQSDRRDLERPPGAAAGADPRPSRAARRRARGGQARARRRGARRTPTGC